MILTILTSIHVRDGLFNGLWTAEIKSTTVHACSVCFLKYIFNTDSIKTVRNNKHQTNHVLSCLFCPYFPWCSKYINSRAIIFKDFVSNLSFLAKIALQPSEHDLQVSIIDLPINLLVCLKVNLSPLFFFFFLMENLY